MVGTDTSPIVVGRDEDLELIANAIEEASAGRPRLLLVGGEAGVGKTRLVKEAVERARGAGSAVLFGSCLDIADGGLPYLPIAEALRGLARSMRPDELDTVLGPARSDLAAIAPELWGTAPASEPPLDPASERTAVPDRPEPSGADRARLFERWIGLVGRLGRDRPVLAIVDDVQWIDRASRDLITFLVRNVTTEQVVAVLTYRSEELPPGHPTSAWLAELSRAPGSVRIDLGRLDRVAVRRQLEAIAGGQLPGDLVSRIWTRSEGNPLFVEELLAAARREPAGVRPPSLVEILLARTLDLPAASLEVLAAVAIAGRPVDERLLAPILGRTQREVAEALREAITRGVLVVEPADGRYRFRHELLREAFERGLLAGERRELHERFARLLEAESELGDPGPAGAAAELAYHWDAADRTIEAHRAVIEAARAAEAVHAIAEAHLHYDRALELEGALPAANMPSVDERIELRRRAADAADLDGDFERATVLVRDALSLVDEAADPTTAGLLHGRLGYLRWLTGDSASSIDEHREAVRLVPAEPPTAARARVLGGLGGALMGAGRWQESRAFCEEAISCAIAAGTRADESRARNMLGSDLVFLGEIEAGLDELRQARAIASETGPPDMLIVGHFNLALNLLAADHLDEALAEAGAGRQATRDTGLERRYGVDMAALLADILLRLGRWPEAADVTSDGLALESRDEASTYLSAVRARVCALRGDAEEAERRLGGIDRSSLDPDVAAFVAGVRAEAALLAGQPEAALDAVREGLASLEGLEEMLWVAPVLGLGASALAERAEAARASRDRSAAAPDDGTARLLQEQIDRLAARANTGSARAWTALARAELARVAGAVDPATWLGVADAWADVPDAYQAAWAQLRASEAALRAEGMRAGVDDILRSAHATAIGLGASMLGTEIEALARRARIDLDAAPAAVAVAPQADAASAGIAVGPGRRGKGVERPHGLSERELEVLALVAAGRTNGQIAEELFITRKTAAVHVTHILDKLGVSNRVEAAMIAARLGLATAAAGED